MTASGTEAKVLEVIARLKLANRREICKALDVSLEYVDYLLNYLRRKGLLMYSKGIYFLPGERRRKRVKRGWAKKGKGSQTRLKTKRKKGR